MSSRVGIHRGSMTVGLGCRGYLPCGRVVVYILGRLSSVGIRSDSGGRRVPAADHSWLLVTARGGSGSRRRGRISRVLGVDWSSRMAAIEKLAVISTKPQATSTLTVVSVVWPEGMHMCRCRPDGSLCNATCAIGNAHELARAVGLRRGRSHILLACRYGCH